jgi:hypothetical protein
MILLLSLEREDERREIEEREEEIKTDRLNLFQW